MTANEALDILLRSYVRYYDITRENVEPPFAAEAVFHTHDETYFLVKSARLSEADSHEYVYFAAAERLSLAEVQTLDETAWNRGMDRFKPHGSLRNSDVTLVILAEHIAPEAMEAIGKFRRSKSYRYGLQGWSNYRVIALETSSGRLAYNRLGRNLKKLFRNIIK